MNSWQLGNASPTTHCMPGQISWHTIYADVGLLVVFDSYAPDVSYTLLHTRMVWCRAGRFGQILYQHLKNLAVLGRVERRHYLQQRLHHYKGRFQTDILKRTCLFLTAVPLRHLYNCPSVLRFPCHMAALY